MSLYRNIINQAWRVAWDKKYLWFFGLFAVFASGSSGLLFNALDPNFRVDTLLNLQRISDLGIFNGAIFSGIIRAGQNDLISLFIIISILLVIILLAVFIVWLSSVSQAALVNNIGEITNNKKNDFRSGIIAGINNFWPVLGFNVLAKILNAVIILSFFAITLVITPELLSWVDTISYVVGYIFLFVIVLSLSFIVKYAIAFSVLKSKKVKDSLLSGWQLFAKNWLISLEMSALMFFLSMIVSFVYLILAMALAIPLIFIGVLLSKISSVGFFIILALAVIFYIASLLLVGAILSTFQISSWTILFSQLTGRGAVSKIIRMVEEYKSGK